MTVGGVVVVPSKQAALHDSDAAAATFNTCVNIQRMKRQPLIA
jgi:hypothetical protein